MGILFRKSEFTKYSLTRVVLFCMHLYKNSNHYLNIINQSDINLILCEFTKKSIHLFYF